VERISLAVGAGSFRARHRLTNLPAGGAAGTSASSPPRRAGTGVSSSARTSTGVSSDAELADLGAAEAEPARLVPACTRALDAALEAEDWRP